MRPNEGNTQEPVALETTVIATGARPGGTTAKRELFTEETQTVLVFERGAVIRLSAAVADGQLLFLTNKATGKEVVTQVLRKRAFRPTNCYVDLEFTEPCPGFWGIEFPKAAAAGSSVQIAKKLSAEEDSESAPAKPAIAPSVQEVERLKNEVAQLQTQLKSLTHPEQNSAVSVASSGVKAALEISSDLAKKEEEQRLEELFAIETKQELASLPTQRLVAYPQKSGKSRLKNRTQKGAIAACVVLFVVALGVGAYQYRSFFYTPKKTGAVNAAFVQPRPVPTALVTPLPAMQKNTQSDGAATTPNVSQPGAANNSAIIPAANAANDSAANSVDAGSSGNVIEDRTVAEPNSRRALAGDSKHGKNHAAPNASSRRDIAPNGVATSAAVSASGSGVNSPGVNANASGVAVPFDYVTPKLVKGSTSVAPPEAIRNYVSGDVTMDALVDTTGHVQTVKVLSGPAKLHATATDVMKRYVYEPARKNGKPVPAHVQVSLQFWYAP